MKIGYCVGGVILGVFAVAQLLQLLGLFGVGFSMGGVGITILTGLGSYACFQKAFALPPSVITPLDADDPLLAEARRKSKESIPRMLELFKESRESTRVKLPFVTGTGDTEFIWADLLSVEGSDIHVRYVTPPAFHTGKVERLQTHPIGDIDDWVVMKDPNRYIGGYSMIVMMRREREHTGQLRPELRTEEPKYSWDD